MCRSRLQLDGGRSTPAAHLEGARVGGLESDMRSDGSQLERASTSRSSEASTMLIRMTLPRASRRTRSGSVGRVISSQRGESRSACRELRDETVHDAVVEVEGTSSARTSHGGAVHGGHTGQRGARDTSWVRAFVRIRSSLRLPVRFRPSRHRSDAAAESGVPELSDTHRAREVYPPSDPGEAPEPVGGVVLGGGGAVRPHP